MTIAGDQVSIDLDGSSPQATGPINCTLNMTRSAVICGVLMSIGRDVPANAGCYRPITINAPAGSVVNAQYPAPVANRMATGHRIVNAVMGAFAAALPERVPASYYGVSYATRSTPSTPMARGKFISTWNAAAGAATPTVTAPTVFPAASITSPIHRLR